MYLPANIELRTEGGIGVALAYLETAMKATVDYKHKG